MKFTILVLLSFVLVACNRGTETSGQPTQPKTEPQTELEVIPNQQLFITPYDRKKPSRNEELMYIKKKFEGIPPKKVVFEYPFETAVDGTIRIGSFEFLQSTSCPATPKVEFSLRPKSTDYKLERSPNLNGGGSYPIFGRFNYILSVAIESADCPDISMSFSVLGERN